MVVFEKTLTKADVQFRLHVPTHSLRDFAIPKDIYQVDFDAVDITDRTWSFRLSTRKKGGHPKPVLSAGWLAFVHEKDLKENDRIILHVNEDDANEDKANEDKANKVRFRIQAQRIFRLFGENHWRNVEDFYPERR